MRAMKQTGMTKPVFLVIAMLALGIGLWLGMQYFAGQQSAEQSEYQQATVLSAPRVLGPFEFTDHTGQPFNRESLRGRWTFLFFGYTHCPDVCPNTMAVFNLLAQGLKQQPEVLDKTRFALVSVDPERDTPDKMADYVSYFNPRFIGLSETRQGNLLALSSQLGVVYLVRKPESGSDSYDVDHSPNILLIDPEARFHAVFTPPHDPEQMLADYNRIIENYQP
ncbi:MAG: SCO family protein [Granulosicoccaceae bacterium]|jgi:protein SCO1/2